MKTPISYERGIEAKETYYRRMHVIVHEYECGIECVHSFQVQHCFVPNSIWFLSRHPHSSSASART
jgi:hypothetical protein